MAGTDRGESRELTDYPSLPTDIWSEIVLRMPFNKLTPLKCVCRFLRDLITDRRFIMTHPDRQPTRFLLENVYASPQPATRNISCMSLDFGDGDIGDVRLQVSPLPNPTIEGLLNRKFFVCDSHNGLLLLNLQDAHQLILYNPVMGSYEALPKHGRDGGSCDWEIVHDASTNKYTVMRLKRSSTFVPLIESLECVVLDRSSSSWKELALPRGIRGEIKGRCARKNGKVSWLIRRTLALSQTEYFTRLVRTSLLCFDPAEQQFGIRLCSPMPAVGGDSLFNTNRDRFFQYDSTFFRTHHTSEYSFELWSLRDRDAGRPTWSKQHVVDHAPSIHEPFALEAVLQGTDKLIMVSSEGLKTAVYDMVSKKWAYPSAAVDEGNSDGDEQWGIQLIPHKIV